MKPRYVVPFAPTKFHKPGSFQVRDTKNCESVGTFPTRAEALAEADRLNAAREARLMHGRAV